MQKRTTLRTMEETLRYAQQSVEDNEPVNGIKGASVLALLPNFDIINNFIPDYMHGICLGAFKQLINMWLTDSGTEFHISSGQMTEIDDFINSVHPSSEVKRGLRGLAVRGNWKASEWRIFGLIYGPIVLVNYLPKTYYTHFLLLAYAVNVLLSHNATITQLQKAELAIIKFQVRFTQLYGIEHSSYNMHILQHYVKAAINWGLPWASSAFLYEDVNGQLLQLFHGTRGAGAHLFRYYLTQQMLACGTTSLFGDNHGESLKLLYGLLGKKDLSRTGIQVFENVTVLGNPVVDILTVPENVAFENKFGYRLNGDVKKYSRCIVNNHIYTTEKYARKFKRDNSVLCSGDQFGVICSIAVHGDTDNLVFFCRTLRVVPRTMAYHDSDINVDILKFLNEVEMNETIFATSFTDDLHKCCLIKCGDKQYTIVVPLFED